MKYSLMKVIGMLAIAGLVAISCDNVTDSEIDSEPTNDLKTAEMHQELIPFAVPANADIFWLQDFSENTDGWFDVSNGWVGSITLNATEETATFDGGEGSAPFSAFDGYRDEWTGEYFAEIEVYLDPEAWVLGEGFDYTVASSRSNGDHLRDYIFHLTKDSSTGALLVSGSNNTNGAPREDLETINSYEVTEAGWYTLQHRFYDNSGALAVDLNLYNSNEVLLFTETRTNSDDIIETVVGGNRYSWFTFISVANGVEVDNHSLYQVAAVPESKMDCKKGGYESFGFRNQGQCIRFVNTGKDSR